MLRRPQAAQSMLGKIVEMNAAMLLWAKYFIAIASDPFSLKRHRHFKLQICRAALHAFHKSMQLNFIPVDIGSHGHPLQISLIHRLEPYRLPNSCGPRIENTRRVFQPVLLAPR
ncbi:hypothetical protein D3C77_481420 [compost metagenome]